MSRQKIFGPIFMTIAIWGPPVPARADANIVDLNGSVFVSAGPLNCFFNFKNHRFTIACAENGKVRSNFVWYPAPALFEGFKLNSIQDPISTIIIDIDDKGAYLVVASDGTTVKSKKGQFTLIP